MNGNWFLVHRPSGSVVQIVASRADCFAVHQDLAWVSSSIAVTAGDQPPDFTFDAASGQIARRVHAEPDAASRRRLEYPPLEEQLDQLWHDLDAGLLPGKQTSTWFNQIAAVKQKFPKP